MSQVRWEWATVTGTSPLRIRMDGATDPLDLTPDALAAVLPLSVGDRVECRLTSPPDPARRAYRVTVTGKV